MSQPEYLSGRLLLALPGMGDPRFERAVIAMCVHDEHGAMGIGIGQERAGVSFHGILEELNIDPGAAPDCPVLDGGPVETGRGFVLHSSDWGGVDTIQINPLCSLSASLGVLHAIAEGRGPSQWIVALGYAGWGEAQLEGEMHHHGWHAAHGRPSILFDTPARERWTAAWQAEGIDPALLANQTGTA